MAPGGAGAISRSSEGRRDQLRSRVAAGGVRDEKLSGQVLRSVSGGLRDSISLQIDERVDGISVRRRQRSALRRGA